MMCGDRLYPRIKAGVWMVLFSAQFAPFRLTGLGQFGQLSHMHRFERGSWECARYLHPAIFCESRSWQDAVTRLRTPEERINGR